MVIADIILGAAAVIAALYIWFMVVSFREAYKLYRLSKSPKLLISLTMMNFCLVLLLAFLLL